MAVRTWFYWHSALGAVFGLLLALICWSGTFATLGHEIDWLLQPAVRAPHQPQRASWAAIYEAVRKHVPNGSVEQLNAPDGAGFAAEALVNIGQRSTIRVYVDPHTAQVLGSTNYFNAWRFFRSLHANLFEFFGWGRYVVSGTGLVLLALVATALLFWKRWWARFLEARAPHPPVGNWSPLHRLVGLWFMWFALLIGATGVWYLVEIVRFHYGDGRSSMTLPPRLPASAGLPGGLISVAQLIERAQAARPDLTITQVRFGDRGQPDYVEGWAGHVLVRARANHLYLDPRDGAVLARQSADDLSAYWRFSEAVDPLHFGDFAGLPSKAAWFFAGLCLSLSGFTGSLLMARSTRLRGGRPRAAGRALRWVGLAVGLGVITVTGAEGWLEYIEFMPRLNDEAGGVPRMSKSVGGFILGWIAVTTAAMLWWVWELR